MIKYTILQDSTNRDNLLYEFAEMGHYVLTKIEADNPKEALDKYIEKEEITENQRYYKNGRSRFVVSSKDDDEGNFITEYRDLNKTKE